MQTDYKTIKKQFEKSMREYDKNAIVQAVAADKMLAKLSEISKDFDNILELGAGSGLLTKRIEKTLKFKDFYANDLVEKSKNYVLKYIPSALFLCGNALKIKLPQKADLVISNAMFQWLDNLEQGVNVISDYMTQDGILAFSTFAPDNFKQIREITGLTLNYKSLEEVENVLKNSGFEILYSVNFRQDLKFNSALEVLAHMKKTGVNSLSEKVWDIKKIKDFCDKYAQKYPSVTLTYSPIIVIAKRK